MRVLAIDTSCDDTCCAIVNLKSKIANIKKIEILSNVVASQIKVHQKYGGVFPMLAKREHGRNLVIVLEKALKKAGLLIQSSKFKVQSCNSKFKVFKKILQREPELLENLLPFLARYEKPKIQAIAVTVGPGLEPCLWVGVNFAKALGLAWGLKMIPVNHIEGHLFSALPLASSSATCKLWPAVGLVVSGGHTQLILIKGIGKYKLIGETRDDAAGECFDKTARILGLGYPGGPSIAAEATQFKVMATKSKNNLSDSRARSALYQFPNNFQIKLPRPMEHSGDFDFSFSGLKTAVLYDWQKRHLSQKNSSQYKQAMAFEIQQAVIDVLIKKTIQAVKHYQAKTIFLSGGVSANKELRKRFKREFKEKLLMPPLDLSTDNGAMVGIAGLFGLKYSKRLKVNGNLRLC